MTNSELADELIAIAENHKCSWGDPGSNPDYLNEREYQALVEAAERLKKEVEA